jgi:DNA polymerase-1
MSYSDDASHSRYVTQDVAGVLDHLGDRPRLYHDALFARAIEIRNSLPLVAAIEDTRIMAGLLEHALPPELSAPASPTSRLTSSEAAMAASTGRVHQVRSLYQQLVPRLAVDGLDWAYRHVELPVVQPTADMVLNGVRVNPDVLEHLQASSEAQMAIAKHQLREIVGRDINPDAAAELSRLLYQELALPVVATTKTGQPSTATLHPVVAIILRYRQYKPVFDAAVQLLQHMDPHSHRIHSQLDPLGAATGRFSCSQPNLQALPSQVMEAIQSDPGHVLISADISQCELRVLAHFSQDSGLLDAYTSDVDVDIHRRTSAAVLGIAQQAVTAEQRQHFGKTINFQIIYGTTAQGLSQTLDVPVDQAQALLAAYFRAYPGVLAWINNVQGIARNYGSVRTFAGRIRHLPGIWSSDAGDVSHALRQAVNTVIQGTAADLIKLAIARLHTALPTQVRMLLPVHDSVLLDVPEHLVPIVREQVIAAMQTPAPGFTVPIKVDVAAGSTWAACKNTS